MKMSSRSVGVVAAFVAVIMFTSTQGSAQGQGQGRPAAPVTVVNTPLPVAVETPLPVTGTLTLPGTPAQIVLKGLFQEGSFNLEDTILGPRSYTIPAGFSRMLLRHVSCRAIAPSGRKVQIFLDAEFQLPSVTSRENLIEFIPDNEIFGALPQPRQVAHAEVYAFLGISTPDGPTIGDTLRLSAQRDTTTGTGGVTCVVGGELFQ